MDFLLITLLTLLNGLFALSEMALAASRRVRLLALRDMGDPGAAAALRLMDQPTRFLSSIQIGITSIGVLNGIVGEAAFSVGLAQALMAWGLSSNVASILATALVVGIITCITIVFGELVPKRIAQLHPETVARWVAPAMEKLAWLTRPLVALLTALTSLTLRLLRVNTRAEHAVTEEEIRASLMQGVDAGVIEQQEHQMVRNVFHLDDRPLSSLMVPRTDIVWLQSDETVSQALSQLRARPSHSWYPVCRGSLDEVLGLVSLADLLQQEDDTLALEQLAQPVAFIPETLSGLDLLEQFRRPEGRRQGQPMTRLVLVVDEGRVRFGVAPPPDEEANAFVQARVPGGEVHLIEGSYSVDVTKDTAQVTTRRGESKHSDKTLVRFLYPNDIKNTALLVWEHADSEDERFLFLPAIGRVRRISGEERQDSFAGSDFSYEDIGPAAMLSRATAGTVGRRVLFVLPGSEAAVRLAVTKLILPELGHVVSQVRR